MDTKQKITETAFVSFVEYGYETMSLNKIIKMTGLTKGAFYHHFQSKQDLLMEVIDRYMFRYIKGTMSLIESADLPFMKRLENMHNKIIGFEIELEYFPEKEIRMFEFMQLLNECVKSNEELLAYTGKQQEMMMNQFIKYVDIGKSKGEIKQEINSHDLAVLLTSNVRGLIFSSSFLGQEHLRKHFQSSRDILEQLVCS